MARKYLEKKLMSLEARGNFGYPWGAGEYRLGFNALGEENEYTGTYQRQYGRYGAFFKQKRYYPEYVRPTAPVVASQVYFATVGHIWSALSSEERLYFKNLKKSRPMTGFNLYTKFYIDQTPSDVGNTVLGANELGILVF